MNPIPPGAAGSVDLASTALFPGAGVTGASNYVRTRLCSISAGEIRPRAVAIVLTQTSFPNQAQQPTDGILHLGDPNATNQTSAGNGFMFGIEITARAGLSQRILRCDLTTGDFRIPEAGDIEVSLLTWRNSGVATAWLGQVFASIYPTSQNGPFKRPTLTTIADITAGSFNSFTLYGLTRWIDFWDSSNALATPIGNANAPILRSRTGADGYPQIVRDYVNATWFPSGEPCETKPPLAAQLYRVYNDGVADSGCTFRQYLEW